MSTLHAYFKLQGESYGTNADFYLYDTPVADTTAKTVVYQFAEYEILTIDVDFAVSENCVVQLFVHDEQVSCFARLETLNRIQILLGSENACLFANIFGQTQIKFVVVDAYDRVHTLYTDYLAVAYSETSGNRKNIESLDQMIHFIEHEDDDFLKHVAYEQGKKTHAQKNASPADRIDELESIVQCLQNHLTSFQYATRFTTVNEARIDAFEKLHSLHAENLVYIATHPEYLRKSHQSGGILVNRTHMMPEKTLVFRSGLTKDNVENRTILSFIYTLLRQVQQWQKSCVVENTQTAAAYELSRGYALCTPILNRMTTQRTQKLALRISDVLQKLCHLFNQYRCVLSCEYAFMHRVVPPTPFILERLHYRDVYRHMLDWFGSGSVANDALVLGQQLHFASADRLYEYYCLLMVCRLLQARFGFEKVSQSRFSYVPEEGMTFFNNTFVFQKDDVQVSVYYEPYIFTDRCENGLTLFRTDAIESRYDFPWYTPDIVLKLSRQGKNVYAIFDAKWRRQARLTIANDGISVLQKMLLRYVNGIADVQTGEQVQMCWLLQGIDDDAKSPYYTHVSLLAQKINRLKNASGIVRLTPASGVSDFADILSAFIQGALKPSDLAKEVCEL